MFAYDPEEINSLTSSFNQEENDFFNSIIIPKNRDTFINNLKKDIKMMKKVKEIEEKIVKQLNILNKFSIPIEKIFFQDDRFRFLLSKKLVKLNIVINFNKEPDILSLENEKLLYILQKYNYFLQLNDLNQDKKSLYNIFYTCKYDKKLIILLINGFIYNLVIITELKSMNIYF